MGVSGKRCSESFREKKEDKLHSSHQIPVCLLVRYACLHSSPSDFSGATSLRHLLTPPTHEISNEQQVQTGRELGSCSLALGDAAWGCQLQGRGGAISSLSASFCPAYWQRISHCVPPLTLTRRGHPTGPRM